MDLISSFKNISKYFKVKNDKPVIDNYIFQCHYKLTTNMMLAFCILLTAITITGKPIECFSSFSKKKDEVQKVINTYCWITSTFTYQNRSTSNFGYFSRKINEGSMKFHSYYQWVPFMLFFQALLFYVPHLIWKMWEGGKISMITKGLRGFSVDTATERKTKQDKLVQYFVESFHMHNTYAFGYILCEIMNVFNIIFNIYLTNKFLGRSFLTYGIETLKHYQNHHSKLDPMEAIFPRITKCTFFYFGPSGIIQDIDTMCILAQNVLNDKIYLFLWFWFFILAILSITALVYRFVVIAQLTTKKITLMNKYSFTSNKQITPALFRKFQIGDFLLLHFIDRSVNCIYFEEIKEKIYKNLDVKNHEELQLPLKNFNPIV